MGCEDENDTSDGIERRKPVYSADFTKGWGSLRVAWPAHARSSKTGTTPREKKGGDEGGRKSLVSKNKYPAELSRQGFYFLDAWTE